jgi:hypothetical protein
MLKFVRFTCLSLFLVLLCQGNGAYGWDGDWTDGKSGQDYIYDKDNSTGKAGSDPPQTFLTPSDRDYLNVDGKELDDYFKQRKKDYTPYAVLRLHQAIRYEGIIIKPGYYQVKIGGWSEGSPSKTLQTPPPQPELSLPPPKPGAKPAEPPKKLPTQQVFIFKDHGNVIAVIPIQKMSIYKPKRKDKVPKFSLAWLEEENRQPVIKYYDKHWLFSTTFE